MSRSCDEMLLSAESYTTPMLIFRAEKDQIVDNAKMSRFYTMAGSKDKTLIDVFRAWHVLTRDNEFPEILEQAIKWIEDRRFKSWTGSLRE
jgi:esterase/lipase